MRNSRKHLKQLAGLALAVVGFTSLIPEPAYSRSQPTQPVLSSSVIPSPSGPLLGAPIFSTGADIEIEILAADADFVSEIYLFSPGPRKLIGTSRDAGTVVNLGRFDPGVELVFEIFVRDTGNSFFTGDGSLKANPDKVPHAKVEFISPQRQTVFFEDGFGGGDSDFNDVVFQIRGTPLVFIPGFAGSRLMVKNGENAWLGGTDTEHRRLLTLNPDEDQKDIIAADALRSEVVPVKYWYDPTQVFYTPLLDMLMKDGRYHEYRVEDDSTRRTSLGCDFDNQKADEPTLFVFPYDWRRNLEENAKALADYAGCIQKFYPNSKLNILTHSAGGLLARRYILDNAGKVNKLITIAAPWLGIPRVTHIMETGDYGSINRLVGKDDLKALSEFFPGAHELLPSRQYFNITLSPFHEDGFDINGDGKATGDYSYGQFFALLNDRFRRSTPGITNLNFHDHLGQDDWREDKTGVQYLHIFGVKSHADTIGQVIARRVTSCKIAQHCLFGHCAGPFFCETNQVFDTQMVYGDGTVPVISAERIQRRIVKPFSTEFEIVQNLNAPSTARLRSFFSTPSDDLVEHTELTKNPEVHKEILAALSSTNIEPLLRPDPPSLPALYLRATGAASITVTDASGNSTKPLSNSFDRGVPGVTSYLLGRDSALVILPTDQAFMIRILSGDSPIALDLRKATGESTIEAVRYRDLTLPSGVEAQLEITPQRFDVLRFDADGDGTFETDIAPTASVSGLDAQDVDPPTIKMFASQQPTGLFVTLTAEDTGSGVKSMFYSLDETHFQEYTGRILVDPGQTPAILAFADDNVANRSSVVFQLASLGCQPDIAVVAPQGQSSVVVNYPTPVVHNPLRTTVVFSPPSGSIFPLGTTNVSSSATDVSGNIFVCTFAVTVTSPPPFSLTCPPDVRVILPAGQTSVVVNYLPPLSLEGPPLVCSPPPGSVFTVGATTVTCSGRMPASCTFIVNVLGQPNIGAFMQDDGVGEMLNLDSSTGLYQFSVGSGVTVSGTGIVTTRRGVIPLQDYASDRRVLASVDTFAERGTGTVQLFEPAVTFTISDRNIDDNSCACP